MVRALDEAGADAILVAQPHYLAQPGVEGLEQMFAQLRGLTGRPLLIADCLPGSLLGLQPIRRLVEKRLVDGVSGGCRTCTSWWTFFVRDWAFPSILV